MDTIVALSTPIGKSAVAVIRLSGQKAIEIVTEFFAPMPTEPNFLKVGNLKTQHFVEKAMCVYFVAPKSFTGENMVELHCHGGIAVIDAVLETCLLHGARMAENGEFSKRSFINGKQNLSTAEGTIEMIEAETKSAAKAGSQLLENQLGKVTILLQDRLTNLISQTEVALDYPEEDLELPTKKQLQTELKNISQELKSLLSTVETGKIVKYGIDIAIVGAPNVGKSSLLNAFLGNDRAIVTDIAGTTRDTLTESLNYKNTRFNFVDTAGIRETNDTVEAIGVERAKNALKNADVVLSVFDEENSPVDTKDISAKIIFVKNKSDISKNRTNVLNTEIGTNILIDVSAKTNHNIAELKEAIYKMYFAGQIDSNALILTNARHANCLAVALNCLEQIEIENATLDVVALKLHEAWQVLGEITGTTANEDIIDRIFEKFCLGK